jgi:SAP domain
MTLSELRSELERRGLDLAGSKAALETRLAQALVVEMVGPDAAAAAGALLASQGIDQEVRVHRANSTSSGRRSSRGSSSNK